MASSSSRTSALPLLLATLLLLAAMPAAQSATVLLTFTNAVAHPLRITNTSPARGSPPSITLAAGGASGALAFDDADPSPVVFLFNVGPDTYVLVSDNDLLRVWGDSNRGAVVMVTVSGPPCANGQAGLQTVTDGLVESVNKCAPVDL